MESLRFHRLAYQGFSLKVDKGTWHMAAVEADSEPRFRDLRIMQTGSLLGGWGNLVSGTWRGL